MGGKVDWSTVSARESHALSESMFDAAGINDLARQRYYPAFAEYIYKA